MSETPRLIIENASRLQKYQGLPPCIALKASTPHLNHETGGFATITMQTLMFQAFTDTSSLGTDYAFYI